MIGSFAIALVVAATEASAGTGFQSGGGTTSHNFQKIGMGARPAGMGEAFVAVADDVNAVTWNPAGLASLSETQLQFMHASWMMEVGYEHFSFAQPAGTNGGLGLAIGWIHTSGVRRTEGPPDFRAVGQVDGSGYALTFAYGNRLDNLIRMRPLDITVGLAMKVLGERMDAQADYGVGGDLAMQWLVNEHVSFGAVLQNGGAGSVGYLLPITLKLAGALHRRDVALPRDRLTLSGDAMGFIETKPKFHLGVEYRWALGRSALAARAGYKVTEDTGFIAGLTLGVGVDAYLGGIRTEVNYAYVKYGVLGNAHRMGVTLKV